MLEAPIIRGSEDVLIRKLFDKFSLLKGSNSGFTLIESLVALGILTMTLGVIGGGILQSLSIEKFWLDDVTATREARHSASWLSGDALNAEEICKPGASAELAPNATSTDVSLVWYDATDPSTLPGSLCQGISSQSYTLYTATYSKSGDSLHRTLNTKTVDGLGVEHEEIAQITLSQKASSVSFGRSPAGDVLTMILDVAAERNTAETLTIDTFLRRLR